MIRAPLLQPLGALRRPLGHRASVDEYDALRANAVNAAIANSAALWFVERDLSNVWPASSNLGGEARANGTPIGLFYVRDRDVVQVPGSQIANPAQWSVVQGTGSTVTVEPGRITLSSTTGSDASVAAVGSSVGVTVDQVFVTQLTVESVWGDGVRVDVGGTAGSQINSPGVHTVVTRASGNAAVRLVRQGVGGAVVTAFETRLVSAWGASQGTTARKPLLDLSGARPCLLFDGVDDILQNNFSPIRNDDVNASYTLIMAGSRNSTTGPRMALNDGRGVGLHDNGVNWGSLHGGVGRYPSSPTGLNTPGVLSATFDLGPRTLRHFVGGVQAYSADGIGLPALLNTISSEGARFFVGGRRPNAEFWGGRIHLAAACREVMPTADRRAIERFGAFLAGAPYV